MKGKFSQKKKDRFLLDTNIFIWWLEQGGEKLFTEETTLINDPSQDIYVSTITPWEITIKKQAGKIKSPSNFEEVINANNFNLLTIELTHIQELQKLPLLHKDPFDRMLIAQARVEEMTIITRDKKFTKYKVKTL